MTHSFAQESQGLDRNWLPWKVQKIAHSLPYITIYIKTMRATISETYHIMWKRHTLMERKDKKDKVAGKKLSRNTAKGNK